MPGAGKSTLGRQIAEKIHIPFFDLDDIIVNAEQRSIPNIFEKEGEDYFRKIERESLHRIISEKQEMVLACGGGTPCFYDNMDFMKKSGKTVFVDVPVEGLELRLLENDDRPLLQSGDLSGNLRNLYISRKSFYEEASIIVTQEEDLGSIVEKIKATGSL